MRIWLIWRVLWIGFLALAGILLVGCGDSGRSKQDRSYLFRSTVKASYGGRAVQGSAVLRQPWVNSPRGYTRGEATIIDLGNGHRVYMVLVDRGGFSRLYITAIVNTYCDLKGKEDCQLFKKWFTLPLNAPKRYDFRHSHYDKSLRDKYHGYPLLVAFRDEHNPQSVFLVDTEKPTMVFGKRFVFKGLYIERVAKGTPLTREIHKYLPWVDPKHPYWKGKAFSYLKTAAQGTTAIEATLANKLSRDDFERHGRRY